MSMTRKQRKDRRKAAAEHAAEHGIASAAEKYGISKQTVLFGANEFKISIPVTERKYTQPRIQKTNPFLVLKRLQDGVSQSDIAREMKVSRQRVSQIAEQARKAGHDV